MAREVSSSFRLMLVALGASGCTSHPLTAITFDTGVEQRDDYKQVTGSATSIDILFVVDNSGSMAVNQSNLASNLPGFIDLISATPADFRIAVTSTDMDDPTQSGRFLAASGNPKILSRTTPNLKDVFAANVKLGTHGSGFEHPLAAMEAALSAPLINNENAGFLRSDALLGIVVVSDEDDCSYPDHLVDEFGDDYPCYTKVDQMIPVPHYVDFLKGLKGGDASKIFYAYIGGPDIPAATVLQACSRNSECQSGLCWEQSVSESLMPMPQCCPPNPTLLACQSDSDCASVAGTSCVGHKCMFNMTQRQYPPHECSCYGPTFGAAAVPGTRNIDMVKSFGSNGIFDTICTDDWNKSLQAIGGVVVSLVCQFPLSELKKDPNRLPSSARDLIVKVAGNEVAPTGWTYNCPTAQSPNGSVSFNSNSCPGPGASIQFIFEPASMSSPPVLGTGTTACPAGQRPGNCGYCQS
jgi:hypothetical protein